MKLWHYKLIPVLPNQMLVSQWRECIAIKRQWEKGTLKHRLVSYVKNYYKFHFMHYVSLVREEMDRRGIKYKQKYFNEIFDFCGYYSSALMYPEHNKRYLKQCFYNLQEKYDRGIISEDEWEKIKNLFKEKIK